jgi:hypothetical protein
MQTLGALLLIALGAGILAVAWSGQRRGVLPAGSAGVRAFRPARDTHPVAFRFFLILYYAGGLALTTWGLLALLGAAPPLRLT